MYPSGITYHLPYLGYRRAGEVYKYTRLQERREGVLSNSAWRVDSLSSVFFSTLLPGTGIPRVPPYIVGATQGRNADIQTPPLCFAKQNIGEVARSDGGV